MQVLSVEIKDKPEDAPIYREPEFNSLTLKSAVIVGKGTTEGNPTVDIIFEDKNGQKYVAMTTGAIAESLGMACAGKRQRDAE